MVYQNKLVAAIKVGGQVLREVGDLVVLPFGSEYSVLVKNLNSVRVQFKVSIDGADATAGTWLVVAPNSSVELERFIRNGNWDSGNRFKFIGRTKAVEKHRGVKADDGIVRIEYQTERVRPVVDVPIIREHYYDNWYPHPDTFYRPRYVWNTGMLRSAAMNSSASFGDGPVQDSGFEEVERGVPCSGGLNAMETGITVPGSQSNQKFVNSAWFETTGQSEVVVIRLAGQSGGKKVAKPVTVKTKNVCPTCGAKSKPGTQFCSGCGTALQLI